MANNAVAGDFGDARQCQQISPLVTFLAGSGFVLPLKGVPKAPEQRR